MARPPIDLHRKIKEIAQHTAPLPEAASAPLSHYRQTGTDIDNLLLYIEKNLGRLPLYRAVLNQHMDRLHGMALVNLIENFERYLKEVAAACVNCLGQYIFDARFNEFPIKGGVLAAHFGTDTLGQALCESLTWLDCGEISNRFRKLLADPFEEGSFWLFPKKGQNPAEERW